MFKFIIILLVTLELVLLSAFFQPANATVKDAEFYTWDYAGVGREELVCKQVIIHPKKSLIPESSEMEPVAIRSQVVSDRYCASSAKPNL
jgi:hypothetical protein